MTLSSENTTTSYSRGELREGGAEERGGSATVWNFELNFLKGTLSELKYRVFMIMAGAC